ncbi:hypothetical protein CK203_050989 [Vitis vinifera]|uniref:Uncharacterized protein n=1 Tax=Vitis vinifera TaxID=29760 RepID=A0A438H340_VITVI|nr:hypothetical protein CK203_050989 [Vitis vinifera]
MGRNEWVGILVKLEVDIGLVSRELLGRGGIFASIEPPLKFVTRPPRRLRWQIFGMTQEEWDTRPRASLGWGIVLTLDNLLKRGRPLDRMSDPSSVRILFLTSIRKKRKKVWKTAPLCIFWTI